MFKLKNIFIFFKSAIFLVFVLTAIIVLLPILPFKILPKPYIVVSGSMDPTIKPGALAVTRYTDPQSLRVGDIIAFASPDSPRDTILHRIIAVKSTSPLRFSTKGDYNQDPDQWDVVDVGVKGIYLFSLPYLGYLISFVRQPLGFIILICVPALLFIISELFKIKKIINSEVEKRLQAELKKTPPKSTLLLLLLATFLSTLTIKNTYALYSSSASLSELSFTLASPPAPSLTLKSGITTFPESSAINIRSFDIGASASPSCTRLVLFYSQNLGTWQSFPEAIDGNSGTFHFSSPEGDGLYSFDTRAYTDSSQESKDLNLYTHQIEVDTQPPTTNLDLFSLGSHYDGQNYLKNGSFEIGTSDWVQTPTPSENTILTDEEENHFYQFGSATHSLQGTQALSQPFSLPLNAAPTLSFSYRFFSHDTSEFDHFTVDIVDDSDKIIENILSLGNRSSSLDTDTGWHSLSRSLAHLTGQNLHLRFTLTDIGTGDTSNSWAYLDDVKISTLDSRVGETTTINYFSSDLLSNLIDQNPTAPTTIGENILSFSSTDSAQNSDISHQQTLYVLPNLILNKITFTTNTQTIELYNNSSTSIDLSPYKIVNSAGDVLPLSGPIAAHTTKSFDTDRLNKFADTVTLKMGDNSIDSTTYKSPDRLNNRDTWSRYPIYIGPWTLFSSSLKASLSRPAPAKITLSLSHIPSDFGTDPDDKLNYEINYTSSAGPQQIVGAIFSHTITDGVSQRDFYLGTCSSAACIADQNLGSNFTLIITGQSHGQSLNLNPQIFNLPL